ncbi:uncharacterized protein LOC132640253 isoform X2 [Lycium barbarum]|uniref:uncharacterized protein LOC132640253 isoform X2 n=1 Tax=Lycium barbarum TaxID=112863 RepID=UPI00293F69F9|nr:uncharacterized protein LOC132640253 isoform X2 [Lycium barbarum]
MAKLSSLSSLLLVLLAIVIANTNRVSTSIMEEITEVRCRSARRMMDGGPTTASFIACRLYCPFELSTVTPDDSNPHRSISNNAQIAVCAALKRMWEDKSQLGKVIQRVTEKAHYLPRMCNMLTTQYQMLKRSKGAKRATAATTRALTSSRTQPSQPRTRAKRADHLLTGRL